MFGVASSHSLGLVTGTLNVKVAEAPAAMVWAAAETAGSAVPLASLTTPETLTL
jgi:hypothetical protein